MTLYCVLLTVYAQSTGGSAAHEAANNGELEILRMLLGSGAKVDIKDNVRNILDLLL